MTKAVSINPYLYNLLIVKDVNDFTITELKELYIDEVEFEIDSLNARQVVYRQVLRLVKRGLLKRAEAENTADIRYKKTSLFTETQFFKKLLVAKTFDQKETNNVVPQTSSIRYQQELIKEKATYEADLTITLSEVEEYEAWLERYPHKLDELNQLVVASRQRAAQLLGKVKALSNLATLGDS